MKVQSATLPVTDTQATTGKTIYTILFSISIAHLLNDMMQSVIPSIYPLIKTNFNLTYSDIGLVTLTYQLTASLLQPFVGLYTDKKPQPFSLATGMGFTLVGLVLLGLAGSFHFVLISVALIGVGSSIFHPESSRVAYLASGGKRGLAQSIFQLGGNAGSSLGPLLAALIVIPFGQASIMWFSIAALLGIIILFNIGKWYRDIGMAAKKVAKKVIQDQPSLSKSKVGFSLIILLLLMFSKYFYMACMTSYFTFFLIDKFYVGVQHAQVYLFVFLGAVAAGTMLGGPLGDRFGRKYIIWISILGVAPFTLLLPHANLTWTVILAGCIGVIIASAFSAILVYAQELMPGKVGMIAGLFFGLAFGLGGLGSAVLGKLADTTSIAHVFYVCSFLPLIGIITAFLPNLAKSK